ncbi:hypothetical protein O3M35_003860 [Rhynocoris fuscipes]|uniref:Aldehyde dehydrogenase domain-containing protein n=1 Tax=Rhynocoris fuscipes TaxID=488301 RepID=A0AAW1CGP5_9HEMI
MRFIKNNLTDTLIRRMYSVFNRNNIQNKAFINGEWIDSKNGKTFDVKNPCNGEIITNVPCLNVDETQSAIMAASNAFQLWKKLMPKERSNYIRKWYEVIDCNKDYLGELIHLEAGKPLAEAIGEVNYGNSFLEWFSEEARRCYGEFVGNVAQNKEVIHIKQPAGVASLITPWNFPLAMITRKAGAALAAGCTVVIKPAEDTPLTALALAHCAQQAGIPKGVINVVTCDRESTPPIGKLLCQSPDVGVVTFTGSTFVGKELYKHCSSVVKRICLELGGNAPFIVFKSADIPKAIAGAAASKFRNAGQTCVSANRFLVEDEIFDEFVNGFVDFINKKICFDDGKELSSGKIPIGPLINQAQFKKVESLVNDAVSKGAKVHCGGEGAKDFGQLYYKPTLLTDITPEMHCYNQEIFGPVVSCIRFSDEKEALSIANSTHSGLAGYFYSKDLDQVFRVSKELEVGMVGVNEGIISTAEAAFGGVKESGIGREGSHYGIDEFINIKYICLNTL